MTTIHSAAEPRIAARPASASLRIEATTGWVPVPFRDLWDYRELLYFLTWRDIKVRYKQTVLGVAWAVMQPLFTMLIFSLFFGRLAKIPSDGIPYPLFSYSALVPWTFFSNALSQSATSIVGSASLIRKIYFPRLSIPLSTVLSGLVDFGVAFVLLLGMMSYYGVPLTGTALWLPLFVLLGLVTALGAGLWLAALTVQFRDVRYVIPFAMQFWMFATPIVYPSSLLAEPWRTVYALNPLVGVIDGFRWALLGAHTAPGPMIAISSLAALCLLASGTLYFRRVERHFADIL